MHILYSHVWYLLSLPVPPTPLTDIHSVEINTESINIAFLYCTEWLVPSAKSAGKENISRVCKGAFDNQRVHQQQATANDSENELSQRHSSFFSKKRVICIFPPPFPGLTDFSFRYVTFFRQHFIANERLGTANWLFWSHRISFLLKLLLYEIALYGRHYEA